MWLGLDALLFNPTFHFSLAFFELTISFRPTILADMNIALEKLVIIEIWTFIEEVHSFHYKEKRSELSGSYIDSSRQNIIKNLDKCHFWFLGQFVDRKDCSVTLTLFVYLFSLNVITFHIISGMWLFKKMAQFFKRFTKVYSMDIFGA